VGIPGKRLGFLLSLALTACAHGAGASADSASVYESRQGERIAIAPGTITICTVVHPLTDCSDAEFFCAASEEIGFRISFPRRCPGFVWLPESGRPMQLLSIFPHGGGARYTTRGGSPFVYVWQNNYGLVMLVYDPRTDFAAHPNADPSHGPTVYERKSGPRLFACR
jgi:hypothetical protein